MPSCRNTDSQFSNSPDEIPGGQIVHDPDLEPCSYCCWLYVAAPAKIMPEKKTPNSPKLASSKPLSCNSIDERRRSGAFHASRHHGAPGQAQPN
jgi:hypothetical protein